MLHYKIRKFLFSVCSARFICSLMVGALFATPNLASPIPVVQFVPASNVQYDVCIRGCECSSSYSLNDQAIQLQYTLIYRSGLACNEDGFCNTYFVDLGGNSCLLKSATRGDGIALNTIQSAAEGLRIIPGDKFPPLIFTTWNAGRVQDFIFQENQFGQQFIVGEFK